MKNKSPYLRIAATAVAMLVALFSLTNVRADYSNTVGSFNPLAYWRFDDITTSPALNIVSNLGSLGSRANGNLILDATKGQAGALGLLGNSVRFINAGGLGYCGSKIDVPYSSALNPGGAYSIEFWVKPNALGGDATGNCILTSLNPNFSGGNRSGWVIYMSNTGILRFWMGLISGYAGQMATSVPVLSVGTWAHVVCTWDGDIMRIYVNGALSASLNPSPSQDAAWRPNSQMPLRFGGTALAGALSDTVWPSASGIPGNRGLDGWVDETAMYSGALSAATIKAHYDAATTNTAGYGAQILADNPLAYWNMNEPAYPTPPESSYPIAVNSGSEGAAADGTNWWGVLANQDGAASQCGTPFGGFGAGNRSCFFNGASGYLAVPTNANLNFAGNITLMAWVKPQVKDHIRDIIAQGWVGAPAYAGASYKETFLRITRGYGNGGYGTTNFYEVGATDAEDLTYYHSALSLIPAGDIGSWVFLAGTYDGSSWKLYRNGQLVAERPGSSGPLNLTNRWSIGAKSNPITENPGGDGVFFGGNIDEPAIFNTALSAANIQAIYEAAEVPPVITRAVQVPTGVFKGSSGSFSVWAEGNPTLTYSWTSNGIPVATGVTNITLNNLSAGILDVVVVVTNSYGVCTSSVSFNVVASKPLIMQQPQAVSKYEGLPYGFSVTAGGTAPISYQWRTNGTDIPGATSSTYSNTTSLALNGLGYSCSLSNEAGTSNSVAAVLTVLAIPTGYAGAVYSNSPIAYWRLGETSGSVARDYYGGVNGTYYGATLNQSGYSVIDPDKAVVFSGVNSYVGDISETAINFAGPGQSFTLESWAKADATPNDMTLIAKGTGAGGTVASEQFCLDTTGGFYRFFVRAANNNALVGANADVGPNGTWQHVVGVYDDTAGKVRIYVNGELRQTVDAPVAGPRVTSHPVSLGSKRAGNAPAYDITLEGTLDEVAIYNTALDDSTVLAHYGAAYGPSLPPFISLQPVAVTNYESLLAIFSVGAGGTVPLSYQWKKNGSDIAGATGTAYGIYPLTLGDSGNYSVTITNVNGVTNSAVVYLSVLSVPNSTVAIPGLVMHLPFDNNLTDITTRGNNGTAVHRGTNAGAISYVGGKIGSMALHYYTDVAGDTYNSVYLGLRPDLQLSSNVNFSVAYWIRLPLNYQGGDLPFFGNATNSANNPGWVFEPSYGSVANTTATSPWDGSWAYNFFDLAGAGDHAYGTPVGNINDGEWHHLVHVFERGFPSRHYLDGLPGTRNRIAGTHSGNAGNVDAGPAAIGQDPSGLYPETGSADIDDLGVWRKALTPLQAAALYVAGTNGFSYQGAAVQLTATKLPNGTVQLDYPVGFPLQSATSPTGPWTTIAGASPPYIVTPTAGTPRRYFRLIQ